MPYYFMRDTPLQALEQLMMSQPGQKPRGGGIYTNRQGIVTGAHSGVGNRCRR